MQRSTTAIMEAAWRCCKSRDWDDCGQLHLEPRGMPEHHYATKAESYLRSRASGKKHKFRKDCNTKWCITQESKSQGTRALTAVLTRANGSWCLEGMRGHKQGQRQGTPLDRAE